MLYTWFHAKLLGDAADKTTWTVHSDDYYRHQILELRGCLTDSQSLFAHYLVEYLIGEHILGDQESLSLSEAA